MIRETSIDRAFLNEVRRKFGATVQPVEIVFFCPLTDRYIAAYEGADEKPRLRLLEGAPK